MYIQDNNRVEISIKQLEKSLFVPINIGYIKDYNTYISTFIMGELTGNFHDHALIVSWDKE